MYMSRANASKGFEFNDADQGPLVCKHTPALCPDYIVIINGVHCLGLMVALHGN